MAAKDSQDAFSHTSSLQRASAKKGPSPSQQAAGAHLRVDPPALQEPEAWQRIFDAVPDPIAILDTQHRIVRVNQAMADRLSLAKDQCVGQTCYSCVHGTDQPPPFCPHSQLLQDGEEHTVEVHEERLAGDFLVSVSPLRDSTGRLVGSVHVARDISEHKRAEDKLRESEARFLQLFSNMSSGVAVYEAVDDGADFVFKDFNKAGEKIECTTKEKVIGRRVTEVFPGVKEFGLLDVFQQVWRTGIRQNHPISVYKDERIVGWRENYVYRLPSGELVAVYDDVTERKRAEGALRDAKDYTDNIICSMADMLVVISPDGTIATVNEATCRSLGYPERELIGQPATLLFEEEDNRQSILSQHALPVKRTVLRRLVKEGSVSNVEKSLRTKGGERIPVLLSGSVMRDNKHEIRGIVCVALDITERKHAEDALRRSEKIRAEAENLASTGQMAAQVAHEINNPLAGIKNSFRLIRDAVPSDHPDHDMVGRIEREIDRIAHVVRQMYKLHSSRPHTPVDVPVVEAIRDVLAMLEPLCREHEVTVQFEAISSELTVRVSEGSLQQVLYNLTANAIHASPRGGVVEVLAESVDMECVRISIRDQGPGIPVEVQKRMFEPFFSSDAGEGMKEGIGLGLSIVKRIVESLEGKIEFESRAGEGTCFHAYLPAKQL